MAYTTLPRSRVENPMVNLLELYYLKTQIFIGSNEVGSNKSIIILKNILQKTKTLQVFTTIIKAESIYKVINNVKLEGLGEKTKGSN
jgi:hypothetical protein